MRPLYQRYDPANAAQYRGRGGPRQRDLLFTHSQDTKPIVESCKAIASNFDPLVRRDTVHVARIPLVIWRQLQRLGITNDEKALNAGSTTGTIASSAPMTARNCRSDHHGPLHH